MSSPFISIEIAENEHGQWGLLLSLRSTNKTAAISHEKTAKTILTELVTAHIQLNKDLRGINPKEDKCTQLYERFVFQYNSTGDLFTTWIATRTKRQTEALVLTLNEDPIFQEMSKNGIQFTTATLHGKYGVTFKAPSKTAPAILEQFITLIKAQKNMTNTIPIAETSPVLSTSTSSESNSINAIPETSCTKKRKTSDSESEESAAKRQKTKHLAPSLKHRQDLLGNRSNSSLFKVYKAPANKPTLSVENAETNNRNNSTTGLNS